jgi:hypothetical protein
MGQLFARRRQNELAFAFKYMYMQSAMGIKARRILLDFIERNHQGVGATNKSQIGALELLQELF